MIRTMIETQERLIFSPFASFSAESKGRRLPEAEDPVRTCYMRDRDRVVHSKAFRRLKHKTQVFISPGNDHYRTRLTHTLEVNQIAKTIGRALCLNTDLIEAIALAHDVGHTPFAHCGESVLNACMTHGFKHNENSVRVLSKIEQHGAGRGLNLSWEVLNGVVTHSGFSANKNPAATLEGQIIRYSDKIAYVQHDIDDTIRANIFSEGDLPRAYTDALGHNLSERITTLVNDLIGEGQRILREDFTGERVLTFSPAIDEALRGLRSFMFDEVYQGKICSLERERASFIVEFLFNHFMKNIDALPDFYQQIAATEGEERAVADYISGMTDNYCVALFKDLTIPRSFIHVGPVL
ncbi:MAG: deoxyguanosinetriphosphate triphosphohydrolase [Peptococcaceae bacterium]|nr:deoxyguanosinetriphosphate triphosphohydrolase [Peptococcaceae bacterium]